MDSEAIPMRRLKADLSRRAIQQVEFIRRIIHSLTFQRQAEQAALYLMYFVNLHELPCYP